LFKRIKELTKQNIYEHQKLNKNQKVIVSELGKFMTVLRTIDDSITKNRNAINQKLKSFVEQENLINNFKKELEVEQQKVKKAQGTITGLMRKLNKINQENNYNELISK
jgi:tRNA U34 5-methylaminomethyl-2-thiouridine-forming methyltransferase MnmC